MKVALRFQDNNLQLYERGAETIGLDFHAHTFWEAYIEHEARAEQEDKRFAILKHLINLPAFQYARYFELYRGAAYLQNVNVLLDDSTVFERLQAETATELGSRAEPSYSTLLRKKIDEYLLENYNKVQTQVSERWAYEQNIQRPYFHVTELETSEIDNWRQYLTYEESKGEYDRIKFLYERCLIATASYEEFWFRYVRWLVAQESKSEEIRNAYQRASFVFIRVTEPAIRLAWSAYEESEGRVAVAIDIHDAILMLLPNDIPTRISLAHLHRRATGIVAARESFEQAINDETLLPDTRGALVAELAQLELSFVGDYSVAGQLFTDRWQQLDDSYVFWAAWIDFEANRDQRAGSTTSPLMSIKRVHDLAQTASTLSIEDLRQLAAHYVAYLYKRGDSTVAKEAVLLDSFINGPSSIRYKEQYRELFKDTIVETVRPRLAVAENAE